MSAQRLYRYTATVNGRERSVIFHADASEWGHEPDESGDYMLNIATARLIIDNDRKAYEEFYVGAESDDYDAEHVDPQLSVMIPARWEVVE